MKKSLTPLEGVLKTFCNVTTIPELSKLFERLVWDHQRSYHECRDKKEVSI
jgi:hypothetical protein